MSDDERPVTGTLQVIRARSLSAEGRHFLGSVAVFCALPAELFNLISTPVFGFAMVAGLTLLVSTIQPKR
jgi:hypothetical protein